MSADPSNDEPPKEPSEIELIKNKLNEFIEKFNNAETRSKAETDRADNLQKELIQLRSDLPGMADQQAIKRMQAIGIPVDDSGNITQQSTQLTENKPQQQVSVGTNDGLPLQNLNLNQIDALVKTASGAVQALQPILQAYGIIPQPQDSSSMGELLLSNKKRFDKWVDLLVTKTLNRAVSLTMNKAEMTMMDATEIATESHEAV